MWRLNGTIARWESARLRASIDVALPQQGLTQVMWQRDLLPDASLMQMLLQSGDPSCSIQLEDCYIRGNDLIARYADERAEVLFPEFYWRVCDGSLQSGLVVIESLLSVQTQLLDSNPQVCVACAMPADGYQVWRGAEQLACVTTADLSVPQATMDVSGLGCAALWKSTRQPVVFGQLIQSSDVVNATMACDAEQQIVSSRVLYFEGRLEKGVIRRARVRGILGPDDRAGELVVDQWRDLLLAPPPLTT